MKRKRGFTLIELLVVISIIAMLMAVMMPALSNARERGRRVVCMAHVRSMVLALVAYAHDYKDNIPSNVPGHNASQNFLIKQRWVSKTIEPEPWINLGRLYGTKLIEDPAIFYCPSQKNPILQQEVGWTWVFNSSTDTATAYHYGLLAQITRRPELELRSQKLSQLRRQALLCDAFIPVDGQPAWAHQGEGLSTGFGDAHVEFINAGKQVAKRAAQQRLTTSESENVKMADLFTASLFEALKGNDYYIKAFFNVRWGED